MIRKFILRSTLSRRQPFVARLFTNAATSSFFIQAMTDSANISSIIADVAPYVNVSTGVKLSTIDKLSEEALIYSTFGFGLSRSPQIVVENQPDLSAFRACLRFSKLLQNLDLPHAIGGALAHGVWTVPRSMMDVDMDVFFTPLSENCSKFLNTISNNNGVFCDHLDNEKIVTMEEASAKIKRDGTINFFMFGRRFDVFFPRSETETDLVWELRNNVEIMKYESDEYPFLSKNGITLVKLLWKRTKDISDLEQMFAANSKTLDLNFIESSLKSKCPDDDPSILIFYELKKIYCKST